MIIVSETMCMNLTENALNFLPRLCKYMMMVKELCRVISRSIKFIMTLIISNFTYADIKKANERSISYRIE